MTPVLLMAVAVAGGAGAALRYAVDSVLRSRWRGAFPLGTLVVNLSGALLIGVIAGALPGSGPLGDLRVVIATGLLGGYTTFSTASVETVRLAQRGRPWLALLNGVGMLVGAAAAAAAGLAIGALLAGR